MDVPERGEFSLICLVGALHFTPNDGDDELLDWRALTKYIVADGPRPTDETINRILMSSWWKAGMRRARELSGGRR